MRDMKELESQNILLQEEEEKSLPRHAVQESEITRLSTNAKFHDKDILEDSVWRNEKQFQHRENQLRRHNGFSNDVWNMCKFFITTYPKEQSSPSSIAKRVTGMSY